MVSNKDSAPSQALSNALDFTRGFSLSEKGVAAAFREELVTWSLRQTRDNLVEWFSFELERFIEHLEDSEL